MPTLPRRLPVALVSLACLSWSCVAPVTRTQAQTAAPSTPAKHKPDPYGSPLDTIMSSHLWTDVPQAQDFVRETRPSAKDLKYTPLTGKDPERPKPRDAANVQALQAELEQDIARNNERAKGLRPARTHRSKKAAAAK